MATLNVGRCLWFLFSCSTSWSILHPSLFSYVWHGTECTQRGTEHKQHETENNKPCWESWGPCSCPPWVMNISMNLDNLHEFYFLTYVMCFWFFHLYIEKSGPELVIINCFENLVKAVLPSPKAHTHRYRFQLWLYGVRDPKWVSGLELSPLWNLT